MRLVLGYTTMTFALGLFNSVVNAVPLCVGKVESMRSLRTRTSDSCVESSEVSLLARGPAGHVPALSSPSRSQSESPPRKRSLFVAFSSCIVYDNRPLFKTRRPISSVQKTAEDLVKFVLENQREYHGHELSITFNDYEGPAIEGIDIYFDLHDLERGTNCYGGCEATVLKLGGNYYAKLVTAEENVRLKLRYPDPKSLDKIRSDPTPTIFVEFPLDGTLLSQSEKQKHFTPAEPETYESIARYLKTQNGYSKYAVNFLDFIFVPTSTSNGQPARSAGFVVHFRVIDPLRDYAKAHKGSAVFNMDEKGALSFREAEVSEDDAK